MQNFQEKHRDQAIDEENKGDVKQEQGRGAGDTIAGGMNLPAYPSSNLLQLLEDGERE